MLIEVHNLPTAKLYLQSGELWAIKDRTRQKIQDIDFIVIYPASGDPAGGGKVGFEYNIQLSVNQFASNPRKHTFKGDKGEYEITEAVFKNTPGRIGFWQGSAKLKQTRQ